MNFVGRVGLSFYKVVVMLISVGMLLFVFQILGFDNIYLLLTIAYEEFPIRVALGIIAVLLLVLNIVFSRTILGHQMKEKTIAFDNPSGRVTISLMAMDDMIRRVIARLPEVKDIKPNIVATKKGIDIDARLILRSDVNIPEITSRLQELIKRKMHETIGLEETVTVRIHISKIMLGDIRTKGKEPQDIPSEPTVPFRGYRP